MKRYKFFGLLSFLCLFLREVISEDKIKETPPFSLFYTEEELAKQNHSQPRKFSGLHRIHLQALFYSGPHLWTLWINHYRISPSHPHPDYHIRHVNAESVQLIWLLEGEKHVIQLRPNQSYDAVKKQVTEG